MVLLMVFSWFFHGLFMVSGASLIPPFSPFFAQLGVCDYVSLMVLRVPLLIARFFMLYRTH